MSGWTRPRVGPNPRQRHLSGRTTWLALIGMLAFSATVPAGNAAEPPRRPTSLEVTVTPVSGRYDRPFLVNAVVRSSYGSPAGRCIFDRRVKSFLDPTKYWEIYDVVRVHASACRLWIYAGEGHGSTLFRVSFRPEPGWAGRIGFTRMVDVRVPATSARGLGHECASTYDPATNVTTSTLAIDTPCEAANRMMAALASAERLRSYALPARLSGFPGWICVADFCHKGPREVLTAVTSDE